MGRCHWFPSSTKGVHRFETRGTNHMRMPLTLLVVFQERPERHCFMVVFVSRCPNEHSSQPGCFQASTRWCRCWSTRLQDWEHSHPRTYSAGCLSGTLLSESITSSRRPGGQGMGEWCGSRGFLQELNDEVQVQLLHGTSQRRRLCIVFFLLLFFLGCFSCYCLAT